MTPETVAATLLTNLSAGMRAEVVRDRKIEGWDPTEHCLTHDAKDVDDLAGMVLLGDPDAVVVQLLCMDPIPREQATEAVPLEVWAAIGIEFT